MAVREKQGGAGGSAQENQCQHGLRALLCHSLIYFALV